MLSSKPLISLPNYEIIRVVGSGSFGTFCFVYFSNCFSQTKGYVFEAWDPTNKKKVALKRVEKVGSQLSREYEILFELKNCDNIVQIIVYTVNISDLSEPTTS